MNKLIAIGVKLAPYLKGMIFADGKFAPKRALSLAVLMIITIIGVKFIGADQMEVVVDLVDELSDVIGYSE